MKNRNKQHVIIGAISLLFLWVGFAYLKQPTQVKGNELIASFDDATGLQEGADVRLSGVKIGEVLHAKLDDDFRS
ncbi:MAG: MCE family protein, partial [Alphaproteobacteria bacterium]|nr:MCE family protein [Alphaproteobacteria bacterium]